MKILEKDHVRQTVGVCREGGLKANVCLRLADRPGGAEKGGQWFLQEDAEDTARDND